MYYYFKSYWKSFLVLIMVLYLSFASPSTFEGIKIPFPQADKIIHCIMYAAFAAILSFDFFTQKKRNKSKLSFIVICIILPVMIGGLVELIQEKFFYPRSAEWIDWLSDTLGVLFIWLIVTIFKDKIIAFTET